MSRGVRQCVGGYWTRPRASGGAFPVSAKFRLRRGTWRGKLRGLETEEGLRGVAHADAIDGVLSSPLGPPRLPPSSVARSSTPPPARASLCLCKRPCLARRCCHLPLSCQCHAFKHQSCHSGSQQVRLLRVLMPQEGSYMMDEICYLVILRNKYAVAVNTGSCRLDANYALLDSRC